ncbi:MAG: uroporphyrinogen-III C-methyltransferase, partial [Xanthomonadales bacterium]|nr:uroporphyrinogen-III C-methyltransferase [Xanthomonadales bacterium]
MDEQPTPSTPELAPPASPPAAAPESPPTRRRGGGWLIAILILIVLLVAAWFGWQWWQGQRADIAASQQQTQQKMQALVGVQSDIGALRTDVDALQAQLAAVGKDRAALDQRLSASNDANSGLRQQLQGLAQRATQLEAAVAQLAQQRVTGHDASLLDDAAMLLRLGQQRYQLFHDAAGAMQAYAEAEQTLAAVNDPAFASVRQSVASEHAALSATHPAARNDDLASLQQLRAQWSNLPLKALDNGAQAQPIGTWQRIWHALSNLVKVDHYSAQSPAASHDAALARQLARLNLAQAQAALLAADMPSYRAALQRVDADLSAHFEQGDAGV